MLSTQAQYVVVLFLVHFIHGDPCRNEPGASILHQAKSFPGQIRAVLDAARPGEDRGSRAFVAMRVNHHRYVMFSCLFDDDAHLPLRINLLSWVGIGKPRPLRPSRLDDIDTAIGVDIDQQLQLFVGIDATGKHAQPRISEDGLSQVWGNVHSGSHDVRPRDPAHPGHLAQRNVLKGRHTCRSNRCYARLKRSSCLFQATDMRVHVDHAWHQIILFTIDNFVTGCNGRVSRDDSLDFAPAHQYDAFLKNAISITVEDIHIGQGVGMVLCRCMRRNREQRCQAGDSERTKHRFPSRCW